jgi:hypothetical protein
LWLYFVAVNCLWLKDGIVDGEREWVLGGDSKT